ncbi:TPA: phospholipase D family protein [Pseudomonas aeruginosa]|uniref:phospholipase D family protein n=1 Tax=Pseudomonas aeruginosa TaxID=287 RepID=UPI0015D990C2|nr:phospholipase D family protein [Pseudomonas aeruginosa]MBG6600005.1 phospholipase D family protein [Pseudomonas aeruginosa]HEK1345228.1 phospholipase D family protein [Pseudomonas aeruginosa]HEK1349650.1 phospholipase D family protein [Pseudomonas aeruginosa]
MARFLNTSATNYFLEELIKNAKERLVLISPFLKLNDRIKELLIDKDRLKIDVRIVYGKSELQPEETRWLNELAYIRTSFCKNLHAKCYLNEELCIIGSLNLYEFSQVNNNEMGILIERGSDIELYKDAYEEAQRLIRISEEERISLERISNDSERNEDGSDEEKTSKLTSSKLGQRYKLKAAEFLDKMVELGYLEVSSGKHKLTKKGVDMGGEFKISPKFGAYFLWPEDLKII